MSLHDAIARAITQSTGDVFKISARRAVGGGSINTTEVLEGGGKKFFVKLNAAARLDMFEAEAEGITTDHIIAQVLRDVPRDAEMVAA